MTSHNLVGGYDSAALYSFRKKRKKKLFVKLIIILIVVSLIGFLGANYLARLPRERVAKNYSFMQKVISGAGKSLNAIYLTLAADREDGANSSLPIAEVYIKGSRLDRLNHNLPESERKSQKAKFKFRDKSLNVKVHYRGDSINHWAFPQKSWRVDFEKADEIDGLRSLNLNVPRSDNQMANWIGYEMARKIEGLLVPESEMVHFRLNRKYDGIRLLLEQPDQTFLRRRNLPYGKIFVGDITTEEIYGEAPRKRLYSDITAWEVRSPTEDIDNKALHSLIRVLGQQDPYRLYYKLNKMVDVESLLKYMALLELVGSVHVDDTHNGKLYLNPDTGLFSPIVWDTVAYFWHNDKPFDLGTNGLFRALLQVPLFRQKKDQYLLEMIRGKLSDGILQQLVDRQVEFMRKDVYAFALKLHASDRGILNVSNSEWEHSISSLKETIRSRNKKALDFVSQVVVEHGLKVDPLNGTAKMKISVSNVGSVNFDKVVLNVEGANSFTQVVLERENLESVLKPLAEQKIVSTKSVVSGKVEFEPGDLLFSNRRFIPGHSGAEVVPGVYTYVFRIKGAGKIIGLNGLSFSSFLGNSKIESSKRPELSGEQLKANGWWNPEQFVKKQEKVLQGQVELKEDLILDEYTGLIIKPGTTIRMAPQVSILARGGGILAEGTEAAPINVLAASKTYPWGVIAVQGGKLDFKNVNIEGGNNRELQYVWYAEPLSVHRGQATLENVNLKDSRMSFKDSTVAIANLHYVGIQSKAYESLRSQIKEKNVKLDLKQPVHSTSLKKAVVYGTGARSEREFKQTFKGDLVAKLSLDEIANEMHSAISQAVKDNSRWQAPKYAGNSYYNDKVSKDFLFTDVYFDTDDFLNYQYGVSYRYRNRYKSLKDYRLHVKRPSWPDFWPHRLEFQAKVNRLELGGGFSTVDESRFEFRKESQPFSLVNLPPKSPWPEDQFIPYFEAGSYNGIATTAAQAVMEFLQKKTHQNKDLLFKPMVVLVTERYRQHLNIKSPWGSGPNPEQSYIVTLDHSKVYEAKSYLEYLKRKRLGYKKLPDPITVGILVEIEIEFERNVSDVLDKQIKTALASEDKEAVARLQAARDAFLADQTTIKDAIAEHFSNIDIEVAGENKSKYLQAIDLAKQSVVTF